MFFGTQYATPQTHLFIISFCCSLGSHFQLYLDSVVDNLQPAAHKYLLGIYGNTEDAERTWARFIAARTLGMAFGSIFSILIPNSSGRKKPVLQGILTSMLGISITYLMEVESMLGVELAIIGRLLNGIGTSITLVFGSTLVSEIAPINKRGSFLALLACLACLGEALGMIIPAFINDKKFFFIPMYLPLLVLIPSFIFILQAPDSPRFLFDFNEFDEAKKSLAFYQDAEEADASYETMIHENSMKDNRPKLKKGIPQFTEVFQDMRFVRALCCGIFVLSLVHLNDWVWISFSTQIFTEVGGLPEKEAQVSSIIMCMPMVVVSVVLVFYFDLFKRKTLLIGSTAASTVVCIFLMIYLTAVHEQSSEFFSKHMIPIVATIDVAVGAIASEGAYAIVPELFDPRDASRGTAISTVAQNVFGSILTVYVPNMLRKGIIFCLVLSIITTSTYCFVVSKCVPETQGKSNLEIANSFSKNKFKIVSTIYMYISDIVNRFKNSKFSGSSAFIFILIFLYQVLICYSFFTLAKFAKTTLFKFS